jgi:hypothetical protein
MKGKLHHKHGIFGSVPILLLQDSRIRERALRVWIALSSFEGIKADSYPGVDAIARRAGVARSSVSAATKLLVDTGWLVKRRRGLGQSNVYECLSYSAPVKEFQRAKRLREQLRDADGTFSEIRESRKSRNPKGTDDLSSASHGNKKTTSKDQGEKTPPRSPLRGEGASQPRNTRLSATAFGDSPEEDVGARSPAREQEIAGCAAS